MAYVVVQVGDAMPAVLDPRPERRRMRADPAAATSMMTAPAIAVNCIASTNAALAAAANSEPTGAASEADVARAAPRVDVALR